MRVLMRKQKAPQNVRKKVEKPPKIWLKPAVHSVMAVGVLLGLVLLTQALNQKLAVTYWDVAAEAPVKAEIEAFFSQQKAMDFWHTRASVIQEALMLAIPDIAQVEVSRILPDGLQVVAVVRHPVALWEDSAAKQGQQVLLVDEHAVPYRSLQVGEAADLPLLRVARADLIPAAKMLRFLADYAPQRAESLSEVIVSSQRWRLNFSHGEQWQLQQGNIAQDMKKMMGVLAQPQWNKGLWRMDARNPQRWFVRPAKQGVI